MFTSIIAKSWLAIAILAATGPALAPASAAPERASAPLAGRWNVVFEMPGGDYETPVEFTVGPGGAVGATILGPLGQLRITDTAGIIGGDRLTLRAKTSFGKLKVAATLSGDRMAGKWSPAGVAALFFKGALLGKRDAGHVPRAPLAVFDDAWAPLAREFYAPDYNGVDIAALRARYRPRAAAARSEGELVTLMRAMTAEFGTSHLDFFATPGWTPELHRTAPAATGEDAHGITWRPLDGGIGYLKIESFYDDPQVIARVDRAFAELGQTRAMVIDLRGNGGGSLNAAMRLGDHVFPELRPVGYFASREGLARRGASSIDHLDAAALARFTGYDAEAFGAAMAREGAVMLMTGGRAPRRYGGRVAVLIDQYSYSASEAFAAVAKETGAATLIGRKTPGLMLGARPVPIDGGWTLMLPVFDFRGPGGGKVEGVGITPDIAVKEGGKDADLRAALKYLR